MKLPEPAVPAVPASSLITRDGVWGSLYTEAQLKQAVRDALEAAAQLCISVAEKNESAGMYVWEARKSAEECRRDTQHGKGADMSTYDFKPDPDDYMPEPPHIANPSKSKPAQPDCRNVTPAEDALLRNATLRAGKKIEKPDCRTCEHLSDSKSYCAKSEHWMKGCINGSEYVEAPAVVLWRTE